jgi:hypothetical protein
MAASLEVPVPHPIDTLYKAWAFNFMVDIACAISHDFVDRPQQYQKVPKQTSDLLAAFRSMTGLHPDWPNEQQRRAHFRVLGAACMAAAPLRESALAYVEDGTEMNRNFLTDAFRDAAGSFRSQTKSIEGQSLDISASQTSSIFKKAIEIFQSEETMGAFGLDPAPKDENWPLEGEGTDIATELIRALEGGNAVRHLLGGPKRDAASAPEPKLVRVSMSQNKFILLQQAARYGALAMSGIMAGDHLQEQPTALIGNTYKWAKALQRLIPDVVRVWKDPNYKARLTDLEWGMVAPHPAEAVSLAIAGTPAITVGGSTHTVRGEICCSTGDLICPSSSNCGPPRTSSAWCIISLWCLADGSGSL